ncbi:MAG: RNA-directed DNA polymerase [Roseburia sp.]|nr:RNA-directed DNA polymerase [Roseburia sp.]
MGKKSVNNLYEPMLEHSNVEKKFHIAAKGKTERSDVAVILKPENIQRHVETVIEQLSNTAPEGYDVPNPEKAWKPVKHGKVRINEGTSKKQRLIEKPRYNYEQVVHHIVVSACYDIFMQGMYEFSCGSVPDRGAHYGKKYIERWIHTDLKNCKYILKMDIRHFFESVDHDVLKAWLEKKIRDKRMLNILFLIIDGSEQGLPLGFYTSQWLSNFMLQPLDHYIKEQLHAAHYIRYMDDMVVFGRNKKELHRMRIAIDDFLRERLNLKMKGNWQVFRFEYVERKTGKVKGRPLDFMGFEFHQDRTILRESIMLSCTRKVNRVAKKDKITWYDATAILSYMGYLTHTDTYGMYQDRVKPYVNVKKLKRIVSKHSKRKEKEKRERVENSIRNRAGETAGVRRDTLSDNGLSETQCRGKDQG